MEEKVDIKRMVNDRKARGMLLLEQGFEPKEVFSFIFPKKLFYNYCIYIFEP